MHDADITPIRTFCLACGGEHWLEQESASGWRRIIRCRWCTEGMMTGRQIARYQEWRIRSGSCKDPDLDARLLEYLSEQDRPLDQG